MVTHTSDLIDSCIEMANPPRDHDKVVCPLLRPPLRFLGKVPFSQWAVPLFKAFTIFDDFSRGTMVFDEL